MLSGRDGKAGKKRSADEAKVLRQMQHWVCVVRNMSAVCCSGKGLRWVRTLVGTMESLVGPAYEFRNAANH